MLGMGIVMGTGMGMVQLVGIGIGIIMGIGIRHGTTCMIFLALVTPGARRTFCSRWSDTRVRSPWILGVVSETLFVRTTLYEA